MDVYNLSVRTTKCINTKLLIDENIIFFYYQPNFTFSKKKNYIDAKVFCAISPNKPYLKSTLCVPVRISMEFTAVENTNSNIQCI